MSDLDDWEFVDDEDAKMTIRAAVRYLLKGAASSDLGDILTEIAEIVRESAPACRMMIPIHSMMSRRADSPVTRRARVLAMAIPSGR
jgi:prephenate dehydrogenase